MLGRHKVYASPTATDYPLYKYRVQRIETTKSDELTDVPGLAAHGRIVALDPGTKRCGVAVCDELRITTRPLQYLERRSWKKLLSDVKQIVSDFDAVVLVVGLPLESDGGESPMSQEAREMARKFKLSLDIPVVLQDERVTSYEAKGRLWRSGKTVGESRQLVDSEAAAIILADFLDRLKSK